MEASEILKQHVTKVVPLTKAEFAHFFSYFKQHTFKKGETVITAGAAVNHEYFVLAGCLKTFYLNDEAKMHILQFSLPTWWTSDFNALYNQTKATVTVDCITDAEVLSISNAHREKLCAELHMAERFFRLRTNKGYVALQKRILSIVNNNTRARYEELMQQYPQLYSLVPKHLIAAYLGVSRETLSRLYNATQKRKR